MIKLISLIISILLIYSPAPYKSTFALSSYARIEEQTYLYLLPENGDSIDNIICLAEKTYFVEIISDNNSTYKVNYNGVIGYVKKDHVREISNTPNTPYPTGIKITIGFDCNLRSSPSTRSKTNNVITTLYKNESDITFIGRIFAEESIDFGGTTWYYVKYGNNYGYIYNKYVSSITPIYENTEKVVYAPDSSDKLINPITHTPSIIIIIILTIPSIFVLIALYLPRKYHKKLKTSKTRKIIDKF